MTFVGFLFTALNFVLLSWFDWNFYASSLEHEEYAPVPNWVWGMAAFNIFLAYTLGKKLEFEVGVRIALGGILRKLLLKGKRL